MHEKDPFVPFVVATVVVGILWSLLCGEDHLHWVPILLALGVVSWIKIHMDG